MAHQHRRPKQDPQLILVPELGQSQHSRTLHYIMGHQKLVTGDYFTYEQVEFCGPLGAIVFTANINDCLSLVPMGILSVLCEP